MGEEMNQSSSKDRVSHWQKTRTLTIITLIIWGLFSFVIHLGGEALNSDNFPWAYFWAGMGSQLTFAILIFWFAFRQDKIDRDHGVAE